jgi:hypothetical protein
MQQFCPYGSVRGATGDRRPYRDESRHGLLRQIPGGPTETCFNRCDVSPGRCLADSLEIQLPALERINRSAWD